MSLKAGHGTSDGELPREGKAKRVISLL